MDPFQAWSSNNKHSEWWWHYMNHGMPSIFSAIDLGLVTDNQPNEDPVTLFGSSVYIHSNETNSMVHQLDLLIWFQIGLVRLDKYTIDHYIHWCSLKLILPIVLQIACVDRMIQIATLPVGLVPQFNFEVHLKWYVYHNDCCGQGFIFIV